MKLIYSMCEMPFIDGEYFSIVSIEAPSFYSDLIREFHRQVDGLDGSLCLSERGKELPIPKIISFQIDPYSLPFNERKLLNRLYSRISSQAAEEGLDFEATKITHNLYNLLEELVSRESYASLEKDSVDFSELLKLFGVKFAIDYDNDLLNTLFDYLLSALKYTDARVFVFLGLTSFLNNMQINELSLFTQREKVHVLLIEGGIKRSITPAYGKLIIVDEDLCEIC